jgi:hypothetical protein
MTQSINDIERDIEESRAKLDLTIDRLQDKLSVSGIVDDVLGQVRRTPYASMYDNAIDVIRRNPVPVMLVAAGIGWLLYRSSRERQVPVPGVAFRPYDDAPMPAVRAGTSRVYSPAPAPLHADRDPLAERLVDPVPENLDERRDPLSPLTATSLGTRM